MVQTIILTGASGALGRNFTQAPPAGFHLKLVSANDHMIQGGDYPSIPAAALPKEKWDQNTSIIHFAAANPKSSLARLERVNVQFTEKIAELAKSQGVKNFIFTSCLFGNPDHLSSKTRAEQALTELFADSDTRLVILKLPPLYGPFFKGEVQVLARLALAGVRLPLDGLGARSPRLSAANLIQGINQILTQEGPSGTFSLCDPENLTLGEVHEVLYQVLHPQKKGCYSFPPLAWAEKASQVWERKYAPLSWAEGLHRIFRSEEISIPSVSESYPLSGLQSALRSLQSLAAWHQSLEED